jgi:phosphoserine phosphatase RsbU/P
MTMTPSPLDNPDTKSSEPSSRNPTNFFRNYNRLLGGTSITILILTTGFLLWQILLQRDKEIENIQGRVDRHAQFIEFMARNSVDQVEAMRVSASFFYDSYLPEESRRNRSELQRYSSLFSQIEQRQSPDTFNLDKLKERDASGNLTGQGKLDGRSEKFYRDIDMALALADNFQVIAVTLPNTTSSRFVGVEQFSHVFPWVDSKVSQFSPKDQTTDIWKLALPESNPFRQHFWAPVYFAGEERGLMAPVGVPIYDGDDFRGVVSIDTSLDYLNRINDGFDYPLGTALVIDSNERVIAHPVLFSNPLTVTSTRPVQEVLPAGILEGRKLEDIQAATPVRLAGHWVLRYPLNSAPWDLVYVLPETVLFKKLLGEFGPTMLASLLALAAIMIATARVMSKEFISPANLLVQQIADESQFKPKPIPMVPSAWRPWFTAVSKAFRESTQLAGIRQELSIAATMQQSILPRHWPTHEDFRIWGIMRPAKEVGGDFYDHFALENGRIGLVVADVSGKGMPAALFSMVSKTMIRATANGTRLPASTVIEKANDQLCLENETCMFVTTFYLEFDPANGSLVYVNGGHPPPLLVHADGTSEFLPTTMGVALGVMDGLPFKEASIQLAPGDYLIVYTDGVTEAFSSTDEEFTEARLPPIFADDPPRDVSDAVERIVRAVDVHSEGVPQSDDITCVALFYRPGSAMSAGLNVAGAKETA